VHFTLGDMDKVSKKKTRQSGTIEVDLFSKEVDSEDHPQAAQFKEMLEDATRAYRCELLSFEVKKGTVSFSFDDDVLTAKILSMLEQRPVE
jgi:hypothetical protein